MADKAYIWTPGLFRNVQPGELFTFDFSDETRIKILRENHATYTELSVPGGNSSDSCIGVVQSEFHVLLCLAGDALFHQGLRLQCHSFTYPCAHPDAERYEEHVRNGILNPEYFHTNFHEWDSTHGCTICPSSGEHQITLITVADSRHSNEVSLG